MPNLISLAPPKSSSELNNYLNWLQEFDVKILKEEDDVEGLLILCGGPDIGVNQERDVLEFRWLQEALDKNIPILGVCRGMQLINHFLGGSVEDLDDMIAEDHSLDHFKDDTCHNEKISNFHWIKDIRSGDLFMINSRHHQHCTNLSEDLITTHVSLDGSIEAYRNLNNTILGVQWHPERIEKIETGYWNQMPLQWIKNNKTFSKKDI
jgi:GMP synthase-like glutamine amidotransferase